jgi:serine/threonine-protein kinase
LAEIASHISAPRHSEHSHSSKAIIRVRAELPFSVDFLDYDIPAGGYRIRVSIGGRISREILKFSMTGGIRRILPLSAREWERIDGDEDTHVWQCVIQSEHMKEDVSWSLALNGELLGKGKCAGRPEQFGSTSRPAINLPVTGPRVIRLPYGEWTYYPDRKLGRSGGFGEVFEGTDSSKRLLAIKRIKAGQQELGAREIQVARELVNHKLAHLIPIFDAGQDVESKQYFIVMGRAQQNLQELVDRGGPVPEPEAIAILQDIISGIEELGERVHRDLKPANILFHEGEWKLADLGLARKALADTSANTVKDFMTHLYAAPEQWSAERASKATDIYAFGCIVYTLLNGEPPFSGTEEDLRRKHLRERPDKLLAGSAPLQVLAQHCLRKEPATRPLIENVKKLLELAMQAPMEGDPIAIAAARIAAEQEKQQMLEREVKQQQETRQRTAADAVAAIQERMGAFFDDISEKAMGVASRTPYGVHLGAARLEFRTLGFALDEHTFSRAGWNVSAGAYLILAWGVKQAQSEIALAQSMSVNLWFAKRPGDSVFRWWEVGYRRPRAGIMIETEWQA